VVAGGASSAAMRFRARSPRAPLPDAIISVFGDRGGDGPDLDGVRLAGLADRCRPLLLRVAIIGEGSLAELAEIDFASVGAMLRQKTSEPSPPSALALAADAEHSFDDLIRWGGLGRGQEPQEVAGPPSDGAIEVLRAFAVGLELRRANSAWRFAGPW
jgi:hypothetical protein